MNKHCGVYKITNKINGKFYIGSSVDIEHRWQQHVNALKGNYHCNIHLQSAWNKYGSENFNFEILEECKDDIVRKREQYYIDNTHCLNRNIGYNISPQTDMSLKSDETKKKISDSKRGKYVGEQNPYVKISEDIAKNIIKDLMNVNCTYDEIAEKYSIPTHIVTSIAYKKTWNYLTKNIVFPSKIQGFNNRNKLQSNDLQSIITYLINNYSDMDIGEIFGVNRKTISDIRNHKTWKRYTNGMIFPKTNGQKRGRQNNKNKLSLKQVKEIKNKINLLPQCEIAKEYGVSSTTISNIKQGKVYSYVN